MASLTHGHHFEQAPGVGDGQGGLACCSPWGCKEPDTTERLNCSAIYQHESARGKHVYPPPGTCIPSPTRVLPLRLLPPCSKTLSKMAEDLKMFGQTMFYHRFLLFHSDFPETYDFPDSYELLQKEKRQSAQRNLTK